MLSLPPVGGTGKKVNGTNLFGKDRYAQYIHEMNAHGTIEGIPLSSSERKEGFKSRISKINFENFVGKVFSKKTSIKSSLSPSLGMSSERLRLRGNREPFHSESFTSPSIPAPGEGVKVKGGVEDKLDEIIKEIRSENAADREDAKKAAKDAEDEARKKNEKRKEAIKNFLISPVQKAMQPITNFFNDLLKKIGELIFADALIKLIDFFGKKENQAKLKALFRFVKDWWPGIALGIIAINGVMAGLALWATGAALAGMITSLTGITLSLGALKWVAAIIGLGGVAKFLGDFGKDMSEANMDRRKAGVDKLVEEGMDPGTAGQLMDLMPVKGVDGNLNQPLIRDTNMPGDVGGRSFQGLGLFQHKLNKGGQVPGSGDGDTVPAMLTPGEFVMSKGAVDQFGVDVLESMNAAGGGTNLPGLGGGGGGTDSLTEQAKVKTWGSAIGDFLSGDDGRSRVLTPEEMSQRMAGGGLVQSLEDKMSGLVRGSTARKLKESAPTIINLLKNVATESEPMKEKLLPILKSGLMEQFGPTIESGSDMFEKALEGLNSPRMLQAIDQVAPRLEKNAPKLIPVIQGMTGGSSTPTGGSVSDGVTKLDSIDRTNITLMIMNGLYNLGSE